MQTTSFDNNHTFILRNILASTIMRTVMRACIIFYRYSHLIADPQLLRIFFACRFPLKVRTIRLIPHSRSNRNATRSYL